MQVSQFNLPGINIYTNPLIPDFNQKVMQEDGQVIRAVNVISVPHGSKLKRPGYSAYLGTPDNGSVFSLFSWMQDSGTQMWTYRATGGTLYYSTQGTGAWTVCGNGTITAGTQVGYTVLNNTLIISQNNGTTRHTTNGTSFSDTSGAPAGGALEQYQNKVFLTGTSNVISASVTGDPTNWATTGTSDGYTLTVPGAGIPNKLFKLANRLMINKTTSRSLFQWDGYYLVDMASNMGPSSPFSYGSVEDNGFWINQLGVFTSNGGQPTLISNPIRRFFYNTNGSAIAGTSFQKAPGLVHRYDYFAAVGSTTDDFTNETVNNAIVDYNFQQNEFRMWSLNDFPTAMHSYIDTNGSAQLIFGNSAGQCFQFNDTATSDNGQPIETIVELMFHFNMPHLQKDWRIFWGFFNPGCEGQVAIAASDGFIKEEKEWVVIGDAKQGEVFYRFPTELRSRFLYLKIIESSRNARMSFYGCVIDAEIVPVP